MQQEPDRREVTWLHGGSRASKSRSPRPSWYLHLTASSFPPCAVTYSSRALHRVPGRKAFSLTLELGSRLSWANWMIHSVNPTPIFVNKTVRKVHTPWVSHGLNTLKDLVVCLCLSIKSFSNKMKPEIRFSKDACGKADAFVKVHKPGSDSLHSLHSLHSPVVTLSWDPLRVCRLRSALCKASLAPVFQLVGMLAIQIVCYYCWLLIKVWPVDLWWCGSPGGRIRQGLHSGDGTSFGKADFNRLFAPWTVWSQVSDYASLESALYLLNEDLSPLITNVCFTPFPHLRNWKRVIFFERCGQASPDSPMFDFFS